MPRKKPEKISNKTNKIWAVVKPRKKFSNWVFEVEDELEYPIIARHVTRFNTYYIVAREHFPYGLYIGRVFKRTDEDGNEIEEILPVKQTKKAPYQPFRSLRFPSGDEYFFANQNTRRHHIDDTVDRLQPM